MKFIHMFFRHLLTGKDGATYDVGRVSWAISMVSIIGSFLWKEYRDPNSVHILEFSEALSAIVVAHGAALGLKKQTEPEGTDETQH